MKSTQDIEEYRKHGGVVPHPTLPASAHVFTVLDRSIWTRQGNEVTLLGRRSISEVWVIRKSDGALRSVQNAHLLCDDAQFLALEIGALPSMRPATAKAKANASKPTS